MGAGQRMMIRKTLTLSSPVESMQIADFQQSHRRRRREERRETMVVEFMIDLREIPIPAIVGFNCDHVFARANDATPTSASCCRPFFSIIMFDFTEHRFSF